MPPRKTSQKCQSESKKSENNATDNVKDPTNIEEGTRNIEYIFEYENPSIKDILTILKEIFNSQQFIATKYDEVINRNLELVNKCDKIKKENQELKEELQLIKQKVQRNEMYLNEKKIEIHGIPTGENEDLNEIIQNIGKNFDHPIKKEEIDDIYRVWSPNKTHRTKTNPIVVIFSKRIHKEKFLSLRKKRSIFTDEIGLRNVARSQVFINEYLTKEGKELLWKAKQFKGKNGFKFLWIKNGKLLLRKNETSQVIRVSCAEDLTNYAE